MKANALCPCCSNKPFHACCEPYLKQASKPHSAEQLMRSRFSAFCLQDADYLIATLHPSQRNPNDKQQLVESFKQTRWFKLTIQDTSIDALEENATVNFIARFEENNALFELHEKSNFIKETQQWYYVNGNTHVKAISLTPKRNEPCWCNSGLKFKKCHGL